MWGDNDDHPSHLQVGANQPILAEDNIEVVVSPMHKHDMGPDE